MRLALITTLVLAGPLPAAAQDGPALYASRCTSCHDSGSPRVPSRTTIAQLTPERVVAALESGTMQAQGASLTAEDRRALAVFITGRPIESLAPVSTPRCPDVGSPLTPRPADPAWNGWGAGPANNRFQSAPAAKLATADVRSLQVKWAFGFAGDLMAAAQPVVIGGRIFVGSSSGRVFALNLRTGCAYWTFDADTTVRSAISIGESAGRALAYFGDVRANVYASDASTGALAWKKHVHEHQAARITGAPTLR